MPVGPRRIIALIALASVVGACSDPPAPAGTAPATTTTVPATTATVPTTTTTTVPTTTTTVLSGALA